MNPFSNDYGPPSRPGRNPLFPFDPTAPESDMYMPPAKYARRVLLAQQARERYLRQSRLLLLATGALTLGGSVVLFLSERGRTDTAASGLYGSGVVFGLLFLVLGVLVRSYPVLTTLAGLLLAIADTVLFLALKPGGLVLLICIKVLFLVALAQAVRAAVASERERAREVEFSQGIIG